MSLDVMPAVRRYGMLAPGDAVLAGVSGGADSMTLLHALCALRAPMKLRVFAAHVNHGLRGAEADGDEAYVRQMCAAWGVELFVCHADVRAEAARTGESEEEAGRRVRYAFFDRTAKGLDAKIATAHTLSDSIETMLLNLARGSGIRGLRGIPPRRGRVIRPLIECTRADVEAYCAANGIRYRTDRTNFDRQYARNRIRLDVVPALYRINPALDRAVLRAQHSLAADEELLGELAARRLEQARVGQARDGQTSDRQTPGSVSLDAAALAACEPALLGRVLARAVREATGFAPDAWHIDRLCALVHGESGRVQLAGGWFGRLAGGRLWLDPPAAPTPAAPGAPLAPGTYRSGSFGLRITPVTAAEAEKFQNISIRCFNNAIDCDRIIGRAEIRTRRPGDYFHPLGRGVGKSLKKLFNEASVPPQERGRLPIVADEQGILWIYGFGADERCRISAQTARLLFIETT